jgi:ABC-type lipoprotein release transport system permease subunit
MALSDVAATRARSAVSAAGIALGVAVLMIIVGLGLGARDLVLKEVVRQLPVDTIEVVPRTISLGLFEVGTSSLLDSTRLNRPTLERLAALDGVAAAHPKLEVKLPMGARGGGAMFGRNLYADLFMTGLPPELVVPEAGTDFADHDELVPVVISDQLLEIYNSSVAPSLGTPRLTAASLEGFEFEIQFGRSLMLGGRGARRAGVERARIVGVSRYAMRLGASVPIATAERLLRDYGQEGEEASYRSILLRARSPADVPAITEAVLGAGLAVDETAERTANILMAATLLATLVGLLVLVLAAMNIAHSFFASLTERRRELAVLRAVGAARIHLILLVLVQAVVVGLAGGVAGVVLAHLGAGLIDAGATALLPDFPFKPESFFVLPGWLGPAALAAAALAAALGALWPALRAAHTSVAHTLNEL